jgi:single-stranded-DNA-specific exonuclease
MTSPQEASQFLNPRLRTLGDPFLLPDMRAAVDSILASVDAGKRIALYGDYDVDGVTSLTLLARMLRAYGASPDCFLPDRIEEGYGITVEGLTRCIETFHPELLIAVDCGTSAAAEIATLTALGVKVVVVDHHECQSALPQCVAVVNPKRPAAEAQPCDGRGTDYRYLCSAGLVFKLCHALLKTRPVPAESGFVLQEHLDLVALGTVADIVPLIGENRILVQKGLEEMQRTRWPGLRALMEVAGVTAPLTPSDVGFQLAPRLNAAGRLGSASVSLELLLTADPARGRVLASALDTQNRDRQEAEKKTLLEADRQIEATDPAGQAAIVVGAPGWHPGVLGIVASRICKKHHRPTFVIGFDANGLGKGSGRSIEGLSLVDALERCGPLLERFGGHEMAAGLTIRQQRFEEFQEAFCQTARELLTDEELVPRLGLDGEVKLGEIDFDFLLMHEKLQPFGMGNAQPLFLARDVRPLGQPVVLKEKHLRLILKHDGVRHEAIFFNGATEPLPPPPWDIAFKVARNEWRDRVTVQIQIQGIRAAA